MRSQKKTQKNQQLTERQLKVIPILLSCTSEAEGCKKAGISPCTLYEWFKQEPFSKEMRRVRNLIVDAAVESLKQSAQKSVATLIRLLDHENPMIQRGCANDILGHICKFREVAEIETRLDALEKANNS